MTSRHLIVLALFTVACERADPGPPAATALSPERAQHSELRYSHDGSRIAFWTLSSGDDPVFELWVANADLSAAVKLPIIAPLSFGLLRSEWSPDDSLIAAGTSQWGGLAVAVVPSAGGAARRLSFGTGTEYPVGWQSGTEWIDYVSSVGEKNVAYVVSALTGVSRRAVPGETRSHVSFTGPGGRQVAFVVTEGERRNVWVADSGGRNPSALTTEGFEGLSFAPWSPDGSTLLYRSWRTGTDDVWSVSTDGVRRRQLTRDIRNDARPRWSPDGRWVAFWSDRGRQEDLWIVPAEGGVERRITRDGPPRDVPSWRPGTNAVAFVEFEDEVTLWRLDLATGAEVAFTPDSIRRVEEHAISDDGTLVAYTVGRGGGTSDLLVQPVAGGPPRLLSGGASVGNLAFSPDGRWISFHSDRAGRLDIWLADVAGGPARRITDWPGIEGGAEWGTDPSFLYFISDRESTGSDIWRLPLDGRPAERITRMGGINGLITRPGVPALFANVRLSTGRGSLVVVRPDGSFQTVWDSSGSYLASISPTGDSITAVVQMPDGTQESRVLSSRTGRGRKILKAGEYVGAWSNDGKTLVYEFRSRGDTDHGLLTLATGETRPLPAVDGLEDAYTTVWTPDDKTLIFRRAHAVRRINTVDVTRLLTLQTP